MIIIKNFRIKFEGTLLRCWQAFYFFPIRLVRLFRHFTSGVFQIRKNAKGLPVSSLGLWLVEIPFLLLDLLALSELLETLNDWLKWGTRNLTKQEEEICRSVFGSSIDCRRVRVDETSRIMCRNKGLIYVGFFTINSWQKFGTAVLVHELMHVWQYQRFGAIYIPRSLLAQMSPMGYDYGGIQRMRSLASNQGSLLDFNFEQQADLIADGYCLLNGLRPRWVDTNQTYLTEFEVFMQELKFTKKVV